MKGQAYPQHARAFVPIGQLFHCAGSFWIKSAHDGKAVGMKLRRFQRQIIAFTFPAWRHDDHAINTGVVHRAQQFVLTQRYRAVRGVAFGPRAFRCVSAPDMYLRISNHHDLIIPSLVS